MSQQVHEFTCPYCPRKSASPGGVRFHVKLTHPDKLNEFTENYLPKMNELFKQGQPDR